MANARGMFCGLVLSCAAVAAHGAASWPIAYSYSPDSMPIVQARLAPPRKAMPEVQASISKLDADRSRFESAQLSQVEAAYKDSLSAASEKLPTVIDNLMRAFGGSSALLALRKHKYVPSFNEVRDKPSGHELSVRFNLLPLVSPDASLETRIQEVDDKLSRDEGNIFEQAKAEMAGLSRIVENEIEAQITSYMANMQHLSKSAAFAKKAASFLRARQPVAASGAQLTTNVRVMASDEPFPTIAGMVEDLERRRDAGESVVRAKILELELQLLQAENKIISDRLESWVAQIAR